jgi:hypothetical protein
MRGLIRRAAVAASAAVVLLGLTAGLAGAAATATLSWSPTTSPGTYNFGIVNAGQKVSQALTLTNSGGKASGALRVTLTGSSAFTTTADTCTGANLSSKKSCRITVQYAPTTPGQTDSATLAATGKTGTASLALTGATAKSSPALATSPSAGGPVGSTTVTDTATLSSGVNPTGTIEFKLYGPSATANCSTTPVDAETATVSGNGSYTTPAGLTPPQAGTYWWTTSYGGDTNNHPASSGCGTESVTISKASPAIATSPGPGGTVGTAVTDTATLAGGYHPTGTIEFMAYGPSATASCLTTPVFDQTVTVSGDGGHSSASFTPSEAGTYWWAASYSGDTNNNPITSGCDQEQVSIAKASPAITTAPAASGAGTVGSTTVTDTATLPDGHNPTGTIQFKAYGPSATANCTTTPVDDETATVTGTGSSTTLAGFTPAQAGTYWWTASYGGDANNNPAATGCGDESVTIAKASPAISTSPSPGGTVGSTAVTDTATLAGSYHAAGTIEFTLYGPSATATCSTTPVFDQTVPVSGDGTYASPSFTPVQAGTYYWVAGYSDDTNNNPAATNCGDEPVVITKASPALATSPSPRTPVGTAVTDTATLAGGYNPTGAITFNLYGPSETPACSTPVFTDTELVSADASAPFTPSQAGTYWWTASYGGDPNNNPAATNCGDESVIITPPSHLYWATPLTGALNEAGLDGSNAHAIAGPHTEPFGVAVDLSHLYWTDLAAGTINVAGLDGSNPRAIVTGQSEPAAIAVDGSHIYWTNFSASTINEANLDGTGVTILVSGQSNAMGLAVDSSHLYWTCGCTNGIGLIRAANLDGTGATTLLSGLNSPFGLTVDSGHLYWTSVGGTGTINQAGLDGSSNHAILSGLGTPTGVAVDSSHIYWANGISATGTINKANLDGTGVTTLATGQNEPRGVAVGPQ